MGKKKRNHPDIEEVLARPWCYYCERDFDDLKILISHQKAKHFKCERCGRRLNTAGGLSVHMQQVHKETLNSVENALPTRANLDFEIFGMEGIPDDVSQAHTQRLLSTIQQAEADRRAASGNQGPGAAGGAKKPKLETPSELKKRLAEHKARLAEVAAGVNSGDATPVDGGQESHGPVVSQSLAQYPSDKPFNQSQSQPQLQQSYVSVSNTASFPPPFSPPFGQNSLPFPHQSAQYPPQLQPFPLQGIQQYPSSGPQYLQPQPFPNTVGQQIPPLYQNGQSRQPGAQPPPYSSIPQPAPNVQVPPQNGLPPRPATLPPAIPGLPQRPSFAVPPVNAFQMQQMHQGQTMAPPSSNPHPQGPYPGQGVGVQAHSQGGNWNGWQNGALPRNEQQVPEHSLDKIQNSISPNVPATAAPLNNFLLPLPDETPDSANKATEASSEHKGKKEKDKDKGARLIYSDNEISPEEKMAGLSRYAFVPDGKIAASLEVTLVAASG
ncbi:MAG: hypothetical protein M1829_000916 [Trizodia sp. TS-e1964]|nr:MAG: hypothetical protein M1829_000916 [Trizodia sp. TS-e1964]